MPTRLAVACILSTLWYGIAANPSCAGDDPPKSGTLTGTISYKADPARKWRFQRYYVQGTKSGPLAEAVVVLSGAGLKRAEPKADPATVTVDQKDFRFIPETVAIEAGDKIRFTNSDPSTHNVSSGDSLHPFDMTLAFGQESVETFDRAGGVRRPIVLGCSFHSQMRAWIYIFEHPHFAVTPADGSFRFENVPPGEYRLEIVHPAGDLTASQKVSIVAGDTAHSDVALSPDNLKAAASAK